MFKKKKIKSTIERNTKWDWVEIMLIIFTAVEMMKDFFPMNLYLLGPCRSKLGATVGVYRLQCKVASQKLFE